MNTIWLKIAAVAVVLVVVLIVGSKFMSKESTPAPAPSEADPPKTVYDMAERDKQFMEEPKAAEPQPPAQPPVVEQPEQAVPSQPVQEVAQQPVKQDTGIVLPSNITKATTMYFKPMGEIEDIEAQRILPTVTAGRSIGRLPVTHFNLMVQGCRQILQKWPDSWYAFRAKQMLEEMPERFWRNYKVTEQELDISKFLKPRRGTEPRTVEPMR
jgi:hypothetical protein